METKEPPPVQYAPGWRLWYGVLNALLIEVAAVCLAATIIAPHKHKSMFAGTLLVCIIIFLIGLRLTRHSNHDHNENQPA